MEAMDPEMSASTGLTNDVCGRLSLFTRGPQPAETASANPTPSKRRHVYSLIAFWAAFAQEELSDVNEEGYVEVDSPAGQADIFDLSEEDLLQQKNDFLDSISKLSPAEAKNKVGEALYLQISAEEPALAGKLTGMFLQARAPPLPRPPLAYLVNFGAKQGPATENHNDLVLLIFSPASLQLHMSQAKAVLIHAEAQVF
ncbi:hypothetical protein T484DRAFT_1803818 [Baffinella frigidus]|nr:hypothetical protein T484DRAFT_1803818 [Cryptophyta sp. CCMP2293]